MVHECTKTRVGQAKSRAECTELSQLFPKSDGGKRAGLQELTTHKFSFEGQWQSARRR